MCNNTNAKDDRSVGTPTNLDTYERLWHCRDLEIEALWKRSAMLGVFMLATYAGYGTLMLGIIGHGFVWQSWLFNLLSMGMCCFGMVFSMLWILMLKGSKRWYEVCEAALNESCNHKDGAFGAFYVSQGERLAEARYLPFSLCGGNYSVSRVAIAIGVISLVVWGLLAVIHGLIFTAPEYFNLQRFGQKLVLWVVFFSCIVFLTVLSFWVRSETLKAITKNAQGKA